MSVINLMHNAAVDDRPERLAPSWPALAATLGCVIAIGWGAIGWLHIRSLDHELTIARLDRSLATLDHRWSASSPDHPRGPSHAAPADAEPIPMRAATSIVSALTPESVTLDALTLSRRRIESADAPTADALRLELTGSATRGSAMATLISRLMGSPYLTEVRSREIASAGDRRFSITALMERP